MKDFKLLHEHMNFDKFKMNSEEHGFNTIVISGPCQGGISDKLRVGRIVQVRKKSGAFGSDTVLLRTLDGLQSFENQSFMTVNEEFEKYYDNLFKDIYLDEPDIEYDISGKHSAKGFIVHDMDCTDGKISSIMITESEDEDGNKITTIK